MDVNLSLNSVDKGVFKFTFLQSPKYTYVWVIGLLYFYRYYNISNFIISLIFISVLWDSRLYTDKINDDDIRVVS